MSPSRPKHAIPHAAKPHIYHKQTQFANENLVTLSQQWKK